MLHYRHLDTLNQQLESSYAEGRTKQRRSRDHGRGLSLLLNYADTSMCGTISFCGTEQVYSSDTPMVNTYNHFDPISMTYAPMEASDLLAQDLILKAQGAFPFFLRPVTASFDCFFLLFFVPKNGGSKPSS